MQYNNNIFSLSSDVRPYVLQPLFIAVMPFALDYNNCFICYFVNQTVFEVNSSTPFLPLPPTLV